MTTAAPAALNLPSPPDNEPLSDFIDNFFDPTIYQPNAWVPISHQYMELAFVCVFNALTLILIITRTALRRRTVGHFRKDDYWLLGAAVLLICPLSVGQIGANRWGEGLHNWNVPADWLNNEYRYSMAYVGYYGVVSMIKISILFGFLEILPPVFRGLRIMAYVLSALIAALGIAEILVNTFQCQPFMSNFDLSVNSTSCLPTDKIRYAWVGISIAFDLAMIVIPFSMLRLMRLRKHERVVLMAVFGATLLGTFAVAASCYAIYKNQVFSIGNVAADNPYNQAYFVISNSAEIFFYTVGTSATVASKFFISKAETYAQRSKKLGGSSDPTQEISWPTSNYNFGLATPGYDPSWDVEKSIPFGHCHECGSPLPTTPPTPYSPLSMPSLGRNLRFNTPR